MRARHKHSAILWGLLGTMMWFFLSWNGTFEKPLSGQEVAHYLSVMKELKPDADLELIRQFMQEDDGNPVVMVNVSKLRDEPIPIGEKTFGATTEQTLRVYTNFVFPYLIKRGSYPIYAGDAILPPMEQWGEENPEEWSNSALVRYRSRRVLIGMAVHPDFLAFHDAKVAAIEKTFAYPTSVQLSTGNLVVTVGLLLLSTGLAGQLIIEKCHR